MMSRGDAGTRGRGDAGTRGVLGVHLSARPRVLLVLVVALMACRPPQKMADQPQYDPLEPSAFFADGMSARQPVAGTIARGQLEEDLFLTTGKAGNAFVTSFPFAITEQVMRRGHERYEIYCAPCHGATGAGEGMIVQRGFRRPTSFHDPRLRGETPGYFYDVIINGFGAMPSYRGQVSVHDRWAIVAYIRALQLSQNATINDVPLDARSALLGPASRVPRPGSAPAHVSDPGPGTRDPGPHP